MDSTGQDNQLTKKIGRFECVLGSLIGLGCQGNPAVLCYDMRFIGVIPARYFSSRLPGKPLIEIAGKPLIQWVCERARRAARLAEVLVATDNEQVFQVVTNFGGKARMTRADHVSGTDRVAEVAENIEGDIFVNIQGDEPGISPATIDGVCAPFEEDFELQVTTARVKITKLAEVESRDVVKVVVDRQDRALYFSRSVIPYPRYPPAIFYKHLGIYGYRRDSLLSLSRRKPSQLENIEGLEQLRFLEEGISIKVIQTDEDSIGVDTPEDVERVRPFLENVSEEEKR